MKIIVTGYNGSGSTALYSLLREYQGCSYVSRENYEHILFYNPNGLFDLEYKLLYRNNLHRSDESIESFKAAMDNLYFNDYGWCGGYKRIIGSRFYDIVNNFTNKLVQFQFEGYWANDLDGLKFSLFETFKDVLRSLLNKDIHNFGKAIRKPKDNKIYISFPTEEEFYSLAREFVSNYMSLFNNNGNKNLLFDHLLMPQDVNALDKYFDNQTRLVIVERDLRDLYLYGKYIRPKRGYRSKYPVEVEQFVDFWRRMKKFETNLHSEKALKIKLEDLVFRYDETIKLIENFTSLSPSSHVKRGVLFKKDFAKENINYVKLNDSWRQEVISIEAAFPDQLYDFEQTNKYN